MHARRRHGHFGWQNAGGIGQQAIGRARNLLFLAMSVESEYYEQLEDDVKKRYNDKLSSIGE